MMMTTISLSNLSTESNNGQPNITMNENNILFEDTQPNKITKYLLIITNKEKIDYDIQLTNLIEPFFTKYDKLMKLGGWCCVKIPIEFRPSEPRYYEGNIQIRIDGHDIPYVPLECTLKGNCVS